jgi:hypothetical protein
MHTLHRFRSYSSLEHLTPAYLAISVQATESQQVSSVVKVHSHCEGCPAIEASDPGEPPPTGKYGEASLGEVIRTALLNNSPDNSR